MAFAGLLLPAVLIIYAVLPFWERVRRQRLVHSVLVVVNATAIGLVVAAVFMLWTRAAPTASGSAIALLAFGEWRSSGCPRRWSLLALGSWVGRSA